MFLKVSAMLALLASASVSVSAQAQPAAVALANNTVHGRVVTTAGKPLADAIVSIVVAGSTDPIISTRTDADGNYELTVPSAPGTYALRVVCMGFTPVVFPGTQQNSALMVPSEITMHSFVTADGSATPSRSSAKDGWQE